MPYLPAGGLPRDAWPFLVATILVHAVYFYALSRAYGSGDFSLVYPIARGLGVALVPLGALIFLDERLSPLGALGVALVSLHFLALALVAVGAGIVGINLRHVSAAPSVGETRRRRAGIGWAVVTGLTVCAYSLVDKAGVARLNPLPYLAIMGVGMSLVLFPAVRGRPGALRREWRSNWPAILVASTMNLTKAECRCKAVRWWPVVRPINRSIAASR